MMVNLNLWLRWSWRDLRARWLQVIAISLIIALGTGVYAGLAGLQTWRVKSLDTSYERFHMHDLEMRLTDGSYVEQDALLAALDGITGVAVLETRLIAPTLVDASTADETILVQGQLVGVDMADGAPQVDSLHIRPGDGRSLTDADSGQNVAILELQFANYYDLKPGDSLRVSGGETLNLVGTGQSPDYFEVIPQFGTFAAAPNFAILFVPLQTAQQLAGREGLVNDMVLLLDNDSDAGTVQAEIERRMAGRFPSIGLEFSLGEDNPAAKKLYADARDDQAAWNVIALLFLIGATLGAFNLAGRIVQAQRRQIGIGMALGVPRRWIAFRPMLVGLQIAILGTILGLFAGFGMGRLFASVYRSLTPLPAWETPLYVPGIVQGMALGILLPFVATLIPVWRAVRVPPVDAIRTGSLVAKGGGLSRLANALPVPGKSFVHMPIKNLLRAPWRSLLTVLGIAMAIMLMTMTFGVLDSFLATTNHAKDAYLQEARDRILVTLDRFYPVNSGEVATIRDLTREDGGPLFEQVETGLIFGGKLIKGDQQLEIALEFHDMDSAIWRPGLLRGDLTSTEPGIIISEKAADDLGVTVGDRVTLEHAQRAGPEAFQRVQTDVPVIGIHNNPIRALSYMDSAGIPLTGLDNATNFLVAQPAAGVSVDEVQRALMVQPGVASVQVVSEFSKAFDEGINVYVQVLRVMQGIVLFMAFLIAFNTTSINVDERVREISTMFAFGLPVRTVTRMQILENFVIGVLGTVIGVILGWYALNALVGTRVEEQLADFKFIITISPETVVISTLLGVLVVALTPLLSIRRMLRLNIPDTLRVME